MSFFYNHCIAVTYGPSSEVSSFLALFEEALEGAGIEMRNDPTFYDTDGEDMTYLVINYSEPEDETFDVGNLIALFPKLRLLLVKGYESAFFLTTVFRHRHDRGFNCCLIDDTFKRGIPGCEDLPIENDIADDLIEEVSNDRHMAFAFRLVNYPLEDLERYAPEGPELLGHESLVTVH